MITNDERSAIFDNFGRRARNTHIAMRLAKNRHAPRLRCGGNTTTTQEAENMAKNTNAKGTQRKAKSVKAPVMAMNIDAGNADAIRDALRGRHVNRFEQMSRTRAMHEVLYAAYERSEGLKASQIAIGATELMLAVDRASGGNGQRSDGKGIECRAVGAHINTMKTRAFIERRPDGLYWLTPLGAHQCKLELKADDRKRWADYVKAQKAALKAPADDKGETEKPKSAKKATKGKRKPKAEETPNDDGE